MRNYVSTPVNAILVAMALALASLVSTEIVDAQPAAQTSRPAKQLIAAALAQVGITTIYDPTFVKLAYPGGDLPRERGVCTDVIVRAYRDAFGIDLQQLVHVDMLASFKSYPHEWGLRAPDASIDHRSVSSRHPQHRSRHKGREHSVRLPHYRPLSLRSPRSSGRLSLPKSKRSPL